MEGLCADTGGEVSGCRCLWAVSGGWSRVGQEGEVFLAGCRCPGWWQEGLRVLHASLLTARGSALFLVRFVSDDPCSLSWSCAAGWSREAGAAHCRVSPQRATPPGAATTLRWPCVHWQEEGMGFVRAVAPGLPELMGWESFCQCSVGNPWAEQSWRLPLAGLSPVAGHCLSSR